MKSINLFLSGKILFLYFISLLPIISLGQDTFSICAVDPVTGQVGSAGATCIGNASTSAIIISDVHPGVGVIHTQASYIGVNQINARAMMNMGYTPQQIIDSITENDFVNNPFIRQYGVVSLDSGGRSAAYTGINCMNYKNHITGPTYSIQGNILLGQQILDSMESRFLNTSGNLACKLMAAMQGAKVVGADTRCTPYGISSYSAFIRVANPNDVAGQFFLDYTVNTFPGNREPIDTLQTLFDLWGGCSASFISSNTQKSGIKSYPNPVTDFLTLESAENINTVDIIYPSGIIIKRILANSSKNTKIDLSDVNPGFYFVIIRMDDGGFTSMKVVK